ncbi:MAG: hypothetical protein K2I77_06605, partial [Anaeroplasmataceae bacterium]|nr:hypothetical protein [Anaeroplasmataceae bacterium]
MIVRLKQSITEKEYENFKKVIKDKGLEVKEIQGATFKVIGIVGDTSKLVESDIYALPGVDEVTRIQSPYKKASKVFHPNPTTIKVGNVTIGGGNFTVMAGPCSVESEAQIIEVAQAVKKSGAHILRGGAYKPRTSPYDFQGLEEKGLQYLAQAREKTGLLVVTEVMDTMDIALL